MSKNDEHALLSASGSQRWTECPASVAMEYGIEDDTSEYAEEGIRAHKLASEEYTWRIHGGTRPSSLCKDEEMIGYVNEYLDYINRIPASIRGGKTGCEYKVDFSDTVVNGYGTVDAYIYNWETKVLNIIDFKYGFSEVKAKDNTQMLLYAIGIINSEYFIDQYIKAITLHIVQPRVNNYDTWTLTYDELMKWKTYFKLKSIRALTLVDEFNPSIEACKYCKAKTMCPALQSFIDNTMLELKEKMDNKDIFDKSQDKKIYLSVNFIKKVLDNSSLIKDYLRTIEDLATDRLLSGYEIDGYKIVNSTTCRKLITDAEGILVSRYGEAVYKKSLLGLGALEKIVGKSSLGDLTYKDQGRPVIVKKSDKRQSINELMKFDNIN